MTLVKDYNQRMIENYADALRSVVAANPNTTAKALMGLVQDYPALADIRLSDILGDAGKGRGGRAKAAKPAPAPKAPKKQVTKKQETKAGGGRKKRWNVRSPEGRAALSAAVLEVLAELGGKEVAAQDIRNKLGATPAQIRTTLNRHIETGAVTFSGKARGTRYSLA